MTSTERETTGGAFDPNKPFRTREGNIVSHLVLTATNVFSGYIGSSEDVAYWHKDGRFDAYSIHPLDLVNVAPTPPAPVEPGDAGEDDAAIKSRIAEAINKGRYTPEGLPYRTLAESDDGDREYATRLTAEVMKVVRALTPPSTSATADDGWRPIETAPKDGTFIDLWFPDNGDHDASRRVTNCRWRQVNRLTPERMNHTGVFDWFAQCGGMADRASAYRMTGPTHWRPLPPPPGAISSTPTAGKRLDGLTTMDKAIADQRRADGHGVEVVPAAVVTDAMAGPASSLGPQLRDPAETLSAFTVIREAHDAEAAARVRAPEPARPDTARGEAVAGWAIRDKSEPRRFKMYWNDNESDRSQADWAERQSNYEVRPLYAATPIAPTLAAWMERQRGWINEFAPGVRDVLFFMLQRLKEDAPTLVSASADAGGMARAVEIVEAWRNRCGCESHEDSIVRRTAGQILAALRQADARQDSE